jgi:hypothetical protein
MSIETEVPRLGWAKLRPNSAEEQPLNDLVSIGTKADTT